jgi:Ca2+-binding RTX toxin-like protein
LGSSGADRYVYRFGDGNDIIEDAGFSAGDVLEIIGADAAEVARAQSGSDLILTLTDGGQIRIIEHFRDKGRIEEIRFSDAVLPVDPAPPPPEPLEPTVPADIDFDGSDGNDRLIGTDADEVFRDGAGKDNLFGKGGADTFILTPDSVADAIKDFDVTQDRIDLSAWGVESFDDLDLSDHSTGKAILRYQNEVLSINDGAWTLSQADLNAKHFIFSTEPGPNIEGSDGADRLIGTAASETLVDGAGKDNLFGKGGADVFVLVADGDADGIKDFEDGLDRIDISAWGATSFNDLVLTTHKTGKTLLSYGNERLSINNGNWTLPAESFDADDFIFA